MCARVETGNETEVLNALRNVGQVKRASLTYRTYDLCIQAQFQTMEKLDDCLFNVVRKISGMKENVSLVTSKTISKES